MRILWKEASKVKIYCRNVGMKLVCGAKRNSASFWVNVDNQDSDYLWTIELGLNAVLNVLRSGIHTVRIIKVTVDNIKTTFVNSGPYRCPCPYACPCFLPPFSKPSLVEKQYSSGPFLVRK